MILDPFCFLHLHASGHFGEILRDSGFHFMVSDYVLRNERLGGAAVGIVADADAGVKAAMSDGRLHVLELADDAEALTYLDLVFELDEGEAQTCALAIHRRVMLASDEAKVHSAVARRAPGLKLIGTAALLRRWVDRARPSRAAVAAALGRISDGAGFRVPAADPDSRWWGKSLRG